MTISDLHRKRCAGDYEFSQKRFSPQLMDLHLGNSESMIT